MSAKTGRLPQVAGLALAATGLSHFVRPELFESLTTTAFPDNTLQHTYVNGGIETAIGVAMVAPKTRKLALAGLAGYGAYLAVSAVRNRRP